MGSAAFRLGLGRWKNITDAKLDALARQSVLAMAEEVHETTPVDVGTLKGAWQPSIGKPPDAPSAEPTGPQAVDISGVVSGVKAGDRFFMVNHLRYAKRIEFGFVGQDSLGRSYDQKGRFWVTRAVKRWPLIVKKVAAELGIAKG